MQNIDNFGMTYLNNIDQWKYSGHAKRLSRIFWRTTTVYPGVPSAGQQLADTQSGGDALSW